MASAHHAAQHSRYALPPPPGSNSDFRLPSLKDLNFSYRPLQSSQDIPAGHNSSSTLEPSPNASQEPLPRHSQTWSRSSQSSSLLGASTPAPQHHSQQHQHPYQHQHQQHHQPQTPHQQHTPPLSAGPEMSASRVDYSPKHDNAGYMTPAIPMSAQVTPVPASVSLGTRGDETSHTQHGQAKRARTSSQNMNTSREVRPVHTSYSTQYASYPSSHPPPSSPFHTQVTLAAPSSHSTSHSSHQAPPPPPQQSHPTHINHSAAHPHPPPPAHEQMQHQPAPVSAHPGYPSYQQQQTYLSHRPPVHPPQPVHQTHPQHSNPYPSPGPPQSAPPPQGPWEQSHHQAPPPVQQHHHQQHTAPPPPSQHVSQPAHVQTHPPPPTHAHMHPQHPEPPPQHHHQAPPPTPATPQQLQTPHMQQRQPPVQPQHQHSYPPPLQQAPQLAPQPVQPPPFQRTTALVPTDLDARSAYPPQEPERVPSPRDAALAEIVKHCQALYAFASRYAQLQAGLPNVQPSPQEMAEMTQRANHVVRLLEEFRRLYAPESDVVTKIDAPTPMITDDHRPPKRPWEDMSHDGPNEATFQEYSAGDKSQQSTAEQDMEIIRTKRASSTAGGSGTAGQPKSKYRKRSRATPPGKCHSCNIRETPEWRRGPDGARTLCNACGLHYAKLMRKRDKAHGPNGDPPRIDLDTLRASARANEANEKSRTSKQQSQSMHQADEPSSPMDQQHHQGSFLVMMPPESTTNSNSAPAVDRMSTQPHHAMPSSSGAMAVPPHWGSAAPSANRGGYAPEQHQSYMRSSQTSPR
ncbi:hypothetical protein BDN72DRAFT_886516 [Pluteus cervinus]|uniref:Uncharacterized protein n=1 Tax=Pluteus cervinus TaxID=181527 RepID=A0ACD3B8I4_9AGAR|nr:hypothetical protein BDN72DRAFT_886516 [Pluteus cervinus]